MWWWCAVGGGGQVAWLKSKRCSECGAVAVVEVVYGLPSFEVGEAELRGEVVLGGCCIEGESFGRDVACRHCSWAGTWFRGKVRSVAEARRLAEEARGVG